MIFVQHKECLIVPSTVVQAGNDKAHGLVPFDAAHTMSLCFTLILMVPFILNDHRPIFQLKLQESIHVPALPCYHCYSAFTPLSNPREDAGRPRIKVNHENYIPRSSRRRHNDAGRFSKRHHAPLRQNHCERQTTARRTATLQPAKSTTRPYSTSCTFGTAFCLPYPGSDSSTVGGTFGLPRSRIH